MARGSSMKRNKYSEDAEQPNPEVKERKRLKTLAFSSIVSHTPAKPSSPLNPSKAFIKHHGSDIFKKSQRKNRFLFSFPGLLAPISGGKLGELQDLSTQNPILYLDFPQGRMKLFGTIVYPKNRYLTLQLSRGGKNSICEDYFDNMIVFSEVWWIGRQDENPEEARLDFPKEFSDEACNEYDFKGGAGAAPSSNKEGGHKTGIKHVEEQSPKLKFEDELSDGENRDLMKATPARHSARTSGKRFNFAEASFGDGSSKSDSDVDKEENKKAMNSSRNFVDIDNEGVEEEAQFGLQNEESGFSVVQSHKNSCKSQGSLVQATISTLFKKMEDRKSPRNSRKPSSAKVSDMKLQHSDSKRKTRQDGDPQKNTKVTKDKSARGKAMAMEEESEVEEDGIEEFSSASQDADESDEDWAA